MWCQVDLTIPTIADKNRRNLNIQIGKLWKNMIIYDLSDILMGVSNIFPFILENLLWKFLILNSMNFNKERLI